MCLSKAYIEKNGERELFMDEVASLEVSDDKLLLKSLLGEQREIGASIKEVDFLSHNIVLSDLKGRE